MLQTGLIPTLRAAGEQIFTGAQLLAHIGRSENWALLKIHDRYAGLVFSIALITLNNQVIAEEIVQEIFIKAWRPARD